MSVDERVSKVERKVSTVEEAIQLLSRIVASHDERLVDSFRKDEDMSEKITMLIDAQIRSEDEIQSLVDRIQSLVDAQARNEDVWRESKVRWEKNNEEFNAKMAALAERQTKSNEELNAKIAILVDNQNRKK